MSTTTATPSGPGHAWADDPDEADRWPEPVPTRVVQERRRAQDPATAVEELRAVMLASDDPGARRAVLANPACPDWIRQAAAVDDPDPDVRAAAVRLAADPAGAHRWSLDPDWQVRAEVARRPSIAPELLQALGLTDADGLVRRSALTNPAIPAEALLVVLTGPRGLDAETAAASPALDLTGLTGHLGAIGHVAARSVLTTRTDAPPVLLAALGTRDPDPGIRAAAVGHQHFPADLLDTALDDPAAAVRLAAVAHPRLPAPALAHALDSPDPAVRCNAAANPAAGLDQVGRAATDDPVKTVRRAACGNPACPPEALATAARADRHPTVRATAAGNPGCPPAAVDAACADPHHQVRRAAIGNPAVTEHGALTCLTTKPDPVTPDPNDPPTPSGRGRRGRAGTTDPIRETARAVLARTPWQRLRLLPLNRLRTSDLRAVLAPHLTDAAGHQSARVRVVVASHAGVPAATLTTLAADRDPRVRAAASTRLLTALTARPRQA